MRHTVVDPTVTEEQRVESWRAELLLVAGYPQDVALELAARPDVDLHVATGLLKNGCDLETAINILR